MREYKFRGKRLDNGEWVYGYLCYIDNKPAIITGYVKQVDGSLFHCNTFYFVIPETVGQYTGYKDKNGEEIYKGDICNCREYECFGKIEWNEDNAGFYFYVVVEGGGFDEERLYEYADELEVIGNIHDNPELLEVSHE